MQSFVMAFFTEHSFGEINLCCVFQSFFFFLNHSVVFHRMNELLFTISHVDRYLGYFQSGALVYKTAMNIFMHILLWT